MSMKKKLIQIKVINEIMIIIFKINLKGLSEAKVDKIKEAAAKICNEFKILTANQVNDKRKMVFKISTGSQEFE